MDDQSDKMKLKPMLIDALHIKMSGALMILNHLVNNLIRKDVDFVLLKDELCPPLNLEDKIKSIKILSSNFFVRRKFYKTHKQDFSVVLCLGNVPPYQHLPIPVFTYFHNVSLLKPPRDFNLKFKIKSLIKKQILQFYKKNTNGWIVQTTNTFNILKESLSIHDSKIYVYPFYYIPDNMNRHLTNREDYIFVGEWTQAKGHQYIIDAWEKLANLGMYKTLHLTIAPKYQKMIDRANQNGANIINHGRIPFDKVIDLYNVSKATVYPSLNESLGLGIIEALMAGCDVIGCDLPYIHCICNPSETFKSCSSDAIVQSVLKYEEGKSKQSIITIKDMVDDLIVFLLDKRHYN